MIPQAPGELSLPFAVSLNKDTFERLLDVMSRLSGQYTAAAAEGDDSDDTQQVVSLFALLATSTALKCNLEHLVGWKVDPELVGFASADTAAAAGAASVGSASRFVSLLNGLLEAVPAHEAGVLAMSELRGVMADSLSVGMPVFCATPADRLNVLASLVQRTLRDYAEGERSEGAAAAANDDSAGLRRLLMAQYFRTMAEPANVVSLLAIAQPRGRGSEARAAAAAELSTAGKLGGLLNNGLTLLLQHTETLVRSSTRSSHCATQLVVLAVLRRAAAVLTAAVPLVPLCVRGRC